MTTKVTTFALSGPFGADARPVSISCAVEAAKLPSFHVAGASPSQCKEISVRVRSALSATGLCAWPTGAVTVAVDDGGAKLQTAALDLPIALAIAGIDATGLLVAGELGLDGSVRSVRGVLAATMLAESLGLRGVLIPAKNAREALEADVAIAVHAIGHLSEIEDALSATATLPSRAAKTRQVADFAEVRGQAEAVAAVEQAVRAHAGLLLSGPPGAGKTMIARRIPGVLPPMRRDEQLDVTRIYSAVGLADGLLTDRPFRAPHHTISAAALAGGGSSRRPGEVHLAARGVLFLDEIGEFARGAIEALAQALGEMSEESRPLVVASANPCPCGWHGSDVRACCCTDAAVSRHRSRIEWATAKLGVTTVAAVRALSLDAIRGAAPGEPSAVIAERIATPTGAGA